MMRGVKLTHFFIFIVNHSSIILGYSLMLVYKTITLELKNKKVIYNY